MASEEDSPEENKNEEEQQEPNVEAVVNESRSIDDLVINEPSMNANNGKPVVATFSDHFTLPLPSSVVRYREKHSAALIVEGNTSQFILEETLDSNSKQRRIEIRRLVNTSEGVRVLRLMYGLVTVFWTGFLFVLCLHVLLFLFLDLAIESGNTSIKKKAEASSITALGVLLAVPAFVQGLSTALVIAGTFVVDSVRGHYLIRNFAFGKIQNPVLVEWVFFAFFLGMPVTVLCGALLVGNDTWWATTLLFWWASVAVMFVLFCFNVVWYELKACFEVLRNRYQQDASDERWGFFQSLGRLILLRQKARLGAHQRTSYLSFGTLVDIENTDKSIAKDTVVPESYRDSISWLGKLTLSDFMLNSRCYESLTQNHQEERVYTIDDARDVRPYITSYTWSLEKIFCRRSHSRYIAIVAGPGAVTKGQLRSSMICSAIGTTLIVAFVFSLLYYLSGGLMVSLAVVICGIFAYYPTLKSTYELYQFGKHFVMSTDALDDADVDDDEALAAAAQKEYEKSDEAETSKAVYLVEEVRRVSKPKLWLCWTIFGLEVILFFIYPLASLISVKNHPLALLYGAVVGVWFIRYYINAAVVLEETGHMSLVDGDTQEEQWKNQSRLNEIVGKITRGRSQYAYAGVLGGICLIFMALMLGAVGLNVEESETFDKPYLYADTSLYQYQAQDSMRYPSCTLTSNLGSSPLNSMAGTYHQI